MGRLAILAVAFMGLLLLSADAQPERRMALVIGNGTYAEAGTLTNPVNDALDIAGKLRSIGFDVIEGNDLGKRELERKIGEFSDALQGAGVGLFYYAGHGLQVEGRNYIVPVDARLDMPVKLQLEAVPIDEVLDIMEQQTTVSLVFLDACRNNPFARSLSRTATTRSATALAGLAQFDSTRGSFIAFSTAPGAVAMDGSGRNSPFAEALCNGFSWPGTRTINSAGALASAAFQRKVGCNVATPPSVGKSRRGPVSVLGFATERMRTLALEVFATCVSTLPSARHSVLRATAGDPCTVTTSFSPTS